MSESPHQRHYDDELALFADQIMSGEKPSIAGPDSQDADLAGLMQTVAGLEHVFKASGPDAARSRRIKASLMREWEASGPAMQRSSVWERIFPGWSSVSSRQILGYAVGVAAMLVIVVALLLPGASAGAASASGGAAVPTILIVGGLAVLLGVFWWLNRPPR